MNWQVLDAPADGLGESPFWHPLEHMLYWIDIAGRKIRRANGRMQGAESWDMPQEPGCIAPARSGGLVIALRDGIYRARQWGGTLENIVRPAYDSRRIRFNDGKCDPLGRLWAGTLVEPRDTDDACVYALDCRGGRAPQLQTMIARATVSNGLAFSPDGGTVYWADTSRHIVKAWDWDAAANRLQAPRVFHQFAPKPAGWTFGPGSQTGYRGRPDGATVDAQGHYIVSMFEGQRLCRFAPDGTLVAEIATPVLCPTMPCFGGDDLRTLYITTAGGRPQAERAQQPLAGSVFSMRADTPGLPVSFFEDD